MKINSIGGALLLLAGCSTRPQPAATTSTIVPARAQPASVTMCEAPVLADTSWYLSGRKAPLLPGLAGVTLAISTTSPAALAYFRQGLMLAYGFNHAEAARSFYEATRQDSTCAMCYWGYSYVLGPNYNAGMEPDNFSRAYRAVRQAQHLAAKATPKEQALIAALATRYPPTPVADRSPYDQAYAKALKAVYQQYPTDPDIGAMYAEAVMNLHPWDIWQKNGQPQPWTAEVVGALEQVLRGTPDHAGANHFYIHATEASKHPEAATKSAQLLAHLVPGAGHLLHMPSHTYIRTGAYHEGTLANQQALQADSNYMAACHAQGMYPLGYHPHNYHFLTATATLEGNQALALRGARKLAAYVNKLLMKDPMLGPSAQHLYTTPYNVAVKFGRWNEVLAMKNFDTTMVYPEAIRHYARGRAWVGKNNLPAARQELARLRMVIRDTAALQGILFGINPMRTLTDIAWRELQGAIWQQEGKYAESIAVLREAVALEDQLRYDEPPDWFFSVRHQLGAVLLAARRYNEAVAVYQQDLERLPRNGWALSGLYEAYRASGNSAKAQQTKPALDAAWRYADTKLVASVVP
ncbi:tetratricopeptide repeat protein [Hymenobacter lucidus]|uniref:Tetratricopeptide repeat protein n=1 Tax=Hymenobacter lucidus TaxID=2880930 RepID=A0ABS8AVP3_9BACT|nr:tetratricopeptide repeat protein [Hymenobacter lucidus]MCB2409803.1 tetratricopeptide repeat protein [Hymenobacter lucidus]